MEVTWARAKKMRETFNELIKEAKTKAAIESDLDKSKWCSLVNLIQALDGLN